MFENDEHYHVHHGDCIPAMASMPTGCVDLVITSVPFPALYAYTDSEADIGNSDDLKSETKFHMSCFYRQLGRILKPGRAALIHVMQIPRMKRAGGDGLFDFRGFNIRLGERAGLVYQYDWLIRKNPQSQALRTRSRELQFAGLEKDRARSRGALGDYLIKFLVPGENKTPVQSTGEASRNDWIAWAEACWTDIRETDTLNVREGKGENDTKHICPLQLAVIRRGVLLYTNPGEIVFDPFSGIASVGSVAVSNGRKYLGCELKDEYYAAGNGNLARALRKLKSTEQEMLFSYDDLQGPVSKGGQAA